jgi:urease accessory protein
VVNAVNATAGMFAGDSVRIDAQVRSGGEMLLTSPSANRIHRMNAGSAETVQTARVESGGWLESWPSMLIPHGGSNYRQRTHIEVERGGRLLCFEYFAPGRVASGEAWKFSRLENDFELSHEGRLIAKERYSLAPDSAAIASLTRQFPTAYCASAYAVGCEMPDQISASINALHNDRCWVGCTRLESHATAARIVAASSIDLMRALNSLRALFHAGFGRTVRPMRRT